jgi:hypothetical protein
MRGKDNPWFWALIQAQGNVTVKPDGTRLKKNERSTIGTCWISVKPIEAILFRTWPGEGCEEANFGLCRYPKRIAYNGRMIATRLGTGWHWGSFCKTQYANEKGVMNFLRCHTLVVATLDYAKELFRALAPFKIRWGSFASVTMTRDRELMRLAADSGCIELFIGFESLLQENLDGVSKRFVNAKELSNWIGTIQQHQIGWRLLLQYFFFLNL